MNKVQINYNLSNKGQKTLLLAGANGKAEQSINADITPELLNRATVYSDGRAIWNIHRAVTDAKIVGTYNFNSFRLGLDAGFYQGHKPRIDKISDQVFFDEVQTPDSLLVYMENLDAMVVGKISELEAQLPGKMSLWEKAVAEHKEEAQAAQQREAEAKAHEKAERERLEAEKVAWIAAHGSDYLKRATALEYDCQRQYVTERAAMELPDFVADFDDRAAWKSRACPSEEALTEAEQLIAAGHDARCVWLTELPYKEDRDEYHGEEFEPTEAVVIRDYLGKYDLVKIL